MHMDKREAPQKRTARRSMTTNPGTSLSPLGAIISIAFAAYAAARLAIASGIHEAGLQPVHHIGLIALHSKSEDMSNILAAHLITQIAASPAYFYLVYRRTAPAFYFDENSRIKKWLGSLFVAALASTILFFPTGSVSQFARRRRALDILIDSSDLFFAGLTMAGLLLLSVGLTGLSSYTRSLWRSAVKKRKL